MSVGCVSVGCVRVFERVVYLVRAGTKPWGVAIIPSGAG